MRILFLHFAREWSGTARALAVAARGFAARGHNVTFLAEPHSSVEQSASRMAAVASKIGAGDSVTPGDVAPFEVLPFSGYGIWFSTAWRLRHLFRQWPEGEAAVEPCTRPVPGPDASDPMAGE